MTVKQFISKFDNHPILFMGAGVAKRYNESAPLWDGLLREISEQVWENNEQYNIIKYEHQNNLLTIAETLEKEYNKKCLNSPNDKMLDIRATFMSMSEKGESCSPFKIFIANRFNNYVLNESKCEELKELKAATGNIASIITTNYDNFIEKELDFKPLIGNDILLSNPYGAVYKIHGCSSTPNSLIITKSDYDNFNSKYELIRSELVSLFIHHPIIFIGYSFGDENIQRIVNTIFQYVEPNSFKAKQVADNFLIVEYKKDENNANVEDYVITCEGVQIRLNKVTTDNFSEIYKSIANLKLRASVEDIRRIQQIMLQISNGEIGVSIDPSLLSNEITATQSTISIGLAQNYTNLSVADFRKDYFSRIEEKNRSMVTVIDSLQIDSSWYFPIFGYLKINPVLTCKDERISNQLNKINQLYRKNKDLVSVHTVIQDIFDDTNIPKTSKDNAIISGALNGKIALSDLESYLKSKSDKQSTSFNKLLIVYDYLKYCPQDKKINLTSNNL